MQQPALTCDGAMDLSAVLQLDGNRLMAEFHQKPASIKQKNHKVNTPVFEPNLSQIDTNINSTLYIE